MGLIIYQPEFMSSSFWKKTLSKLNYPPYRGACQLTLPVSALHLFLSCAILLHCSKLKPVHCRMLSFHYNRGLPLPYFSPTMPSSRLRFKLSCLIMCPKRESFLCFTVWKRDPLVLACLSSLHLWCALSSWS